MRTNLLISLFFLCFWFISYRLPAIEPLQNLPAKKLLCWPAVEPTPASFLEQLPRTLELPFDGYVLSVVNNQGQQLMWEMWGDKGFMLQDFSQGEAQLKELKQKYAGEIFLRMNITPGNIDWFNDDAWQKILMNTKILAHLAHAGSCAGFMFDTEQYANQPFNYDLQAQKQYYSQAQYQRLIRKRGETLIQTIQSEVTSPKIILTFGYYAAQPTTGDGRKGINYELLAPFLDGMLTAINPQAQLIDGWEYSYDYKTEQEFITAKEKLIAAFSKLSELSTKELKLPLNHSQSFGLWIDYQNKIPKWETKDFTKNHFTPTEFKHALELAQKNSAGYVWIYSQKPNWFTQQDLPVEYIKAIKESRE